MPAIITHHLFGEDAANALPAGTIKGQEELLAFLLGNQGPDPLYARILTTPQAASVCHKLADDLHDGHVVEAFVAAREAVTKLPDEDKRVGRAFVLGLLGHYVLDSTAHPFVYAQQFGICEADESLAELGDDVHALIESDIDVWMLWSQRGLTVRQAPAVANLARTERIRRVSSAIFSQIASQVFGTELGADEYGNSVRDYAFIYRLIDPVESRHSHLVTKLEKRVRDKAYLKALAHATKHDDTCPAANLSCQRWRNPFTGKPSTLSFGDLYILALEHWPAFATALLDDDRVALEDLTHGLNYLGQPIE